LPSLTHSQANDDPSKDEAEPGRLRLQVLEFWELFDPDGISKPEHELLTEEELAVRPRNIIDPNSIFNSDARELFHEVPLPLNWNDGLREIEAYYGNARSSKDDTAHSDHKADDLRTSEIDDHPSTSATDHPSVTSMQRPSAKETCTPSPKPVLIATQDPSTMIELITEEEEMTAGSDVLGAGSHQNTMNNYEIISATKEASESQTPLSDVLLIPYSANPQLEAELPGPTTASVPQSSPNRRIEDELLATSEQELSPDPATQSKSQKRKSDIQAQKQPAKKRNLGDVPKLSNEQLVNSFTFLPKAELRKMKFKDIKNRFETSFDMRPLFHAVKKESFIEGAMKWQDIMMGLKAQKEAAEAAKKPQTNAVTVGTNTGAHTTAGGKGQKLDANEHVYTPIGHALSDEDYECEAEEQLPSAAVDTDAEDELARPALPRRVLNTTPASINRAPLPKTDPFYAPSEEPRSSPFNDKLRRVADEIRSERENVTSPTSSPLSTRPLKTSSTTEGIAALVSARPSKSSLRARSVADERVASFELVEPGKTSVRAKSVPSSLEGRTRAKNEARSVGFRRSSRLSEQGGEK
jgi:hypothetical protein